MKIFRLLITLMTMTSAVTAWAEIPTVLTDKIRNGSGVIDIFKDASGAELQEYLQGGTLFLGVDLNEDASGNESSDSAGVAIKNMRLIITTTEGDFSFGEFYTNTTAMIQEAGATGSQEYKTMFGSAGSNQITSNSGFDLSNFDDVVTIGNIEFTGQVIGAKLNVTFLNTANTGENETFFDYSAGFEEFAILSSGDAAVLVSANIGLGAAAPSNISYNVSSPSGTPEPSWVLLAVIPAIFFWRQRSRAKPKT